MAGRLRPWHCSRCGRFLALEGVLLGEIRVKCPRCKEWNVLQIADEAGKILTPEDVGGILMREGPKGQ